MNPRRTRTAAIATAVLALFYVSVVWAASGSFGHLVDQMRLDWYYLALILLFYRDPRVSSFLASLAHSTTLASPMQISQSPTVSVVVSKAAFKNGTWTTAI